MATLAQLFGKLTKDRTLRQSFQAWCLDEKYQIRPEVLPALAYIRAFCYANTSCIFYDKNGRTDALAMAAGAGRQEVWAEFYKYLNLTDGELLELDRWLQEQAQKMRTPLSVA